MGKEPQNAPVKYAKAPDRKVACQLLREIAKRPASFGPRTVDKPLVLYGAGNLGKMAKEYFGRLGIPLLFVVDANPELYRCDSFWEGVDIVSPQDVTVKHRESVLLAVCVSTVPYSELSASLSEGGWRDIVPFYDIAEAYRDRHPLSNGWFSGPLDGEDIGGIEAVLSRWSDNMSRAHHLQFIAWHRLREDWLFEEAPVMMGDRYFIPEVRAALGEREVFVDIGAHYGEVSRSFLTAVDNRFNELWAIEPDEENARNLRHNLNALDDIEKDNIHLLSCAVGQKEGVQSFFEGLGYVSQFSRLGRRSLDTTTMDHLELAPTFLKLHIEGEELNALKGGLDTLQRHRPLIAATSYHNRLGLWELPLWLMDHLPDYSILMRLHSWCDTGAVLYAIPEERYRPRRCSDES